MPAKIRVFIRPSGKLVEAEEGSTFLNILRKADIPIESICGGRGECGKCKIIIDKGKIHRLEGQEKHLSEEDISRGYCLACKTLALSDSEISIPIESIRVKPKILTRKKEVWIEPLPAVRKYLIDFPSYLTRQGLLKELEGKYGIDPNSIILDEEICLKVASLKDEKVTLTVSESKGLEVINIEPGDKRDSNYGLAIDLGTTTIVAELIDLNTGQSLAQSSTINRQVAFGEELVSRIGYASNTERLKKLQAEAVRSINELIDQLSKQVGISKDEINEVCVGGNTVMNHLLAGIDVNYLNFADAKVSREPIIKRAFELGIHVNKKAWIYCLPNVSRFLGGDAVGDVLSSGMHLSSDISLLVDLGTNGEVILGNSEWMISCTVPCGPAWEGGGIKFGMRAMEGAIEHVSIDPRSLKASYTVIGDTKPRGICGSGILDLLAELYSVGLLDFSGKLRKSESPLIRMGKDGLEYVVVPANETAIGRDIVITQKDIDYVLDSKATIRGGIKTLMKKSGLTPNDIKHVYLAGAFSAYIDFKNAEKLGVFPTFPSAEFHRIGNGSLNGAYLALVSLKKRREAEEIAKKIFYIDLLTDLDFLELYEASLYIPGFS